MGEQQDKTAQTVGYLRDQYRKKLSFVSILSVLALVLAVWLAYICFYPTKSSYYATTTEGVNVQLHALSEPVVNNPYLLQWASVAVRDAYNYNFVNNQKRLDQIKSKFTEDGWSSFHGALNKSGLLKAISKKKLVMTAVVSNAPIITYQGVVAGRYTWQIQMPILITFESASAQQHLNMLATIDVVRVPVLQDPMGGIEINDFLISSNSG